MGSFATLRAEYVEIQSACDHEHVGLDHRCPACRAIIRRCCVSQLGTPHADGCEWRRKALAAKRAREATAEMQESQE